MRCAPFSPPRLPRPKMLRNKFRASAAMVELYATARAARRGLRAREGGALGLSRRILAAWQAALLVAVLCLAASFAPLPALAEETAASEEAVAPVSEVEQAMNQVPAEEGDVRPSVRRRHAGAPMWQHPRPFARRARGGLRALTIDGTVYRLVWDQR